MIDLDANLHRRIAEFNRFIELMRKKPQRARAWQLLSHLSRHRSSEHDAISRRSRIDLCADDRDSSMSRTIAGFNILLKTRIIRIRFV
jgi:predicted nicotinamide N-methyase